MTARAIKCSEIMKVRVCCAGPETSIQEVARMMGEGAYGLLPICNAEQLLVGVLTDRDIVVRACAVGRAIGKTPVKHIMSERVVTCHPSDDLSVVEALMMKHQKARIVVTDDFRRVVGIVSLTDIAQHEEPLRAARVLREVSSRQFRIESRGLSVAR